MSPYATAMQLALLAIAALGYAEADTTQFDLICGGVEAASSGSQWLPKSFAEHIRVDLQRGVFCSDACTGLRRLHRTTATEYALVDASDGGRHWEKKVVARPSSKGEVTSYQWRYGGLNIERSGVCVKAQFSGFPVEAKIDRYPNDPSGL